MVFTVLAAALYYIVFYHIPKNLESYLSSLIPLNIKTPTIPISSTALLVGLIITFVAPLGILLKKTLFEGPIGATTGILFAVYLYHLFRGGLVEIKFKEGVMLGIKSATLTLEIGFLLLLFMIPPILTAVKGILLTIQRLKQTE